MNACWYDCRRVQFAVCASSFCYVYILYKLSRTIGLCVCGQDVRLEFLSSGSEFVRVLVLTGELFENSVVSLQIGGKIVIAIASILVSGGIAGHCVAIITATLALKAV